MRLYYKSLLFVLILGVFLTGCSSSEGDAVAAKKVERKESNSIVSMGKVSLTKNEARAFLTGLDKKQRASVVKDEEALSSRLRGEVLRKYIISQAFKDGWTKRQDVKNAQERVKNKLLYQEFLIQQSTPDASYPTLKMVEDFYVKNKAQFLLAKRYNLAQIFIIKADKEAKYPVDVNAILERLNKGESFADLASEFSDHSLSAQKGGELGWVAVSSIQPDIANALADKQEGDIVGPIATAKGVHIMKVLGYSPETYLAMEKASPKIIAFLRTEKSKALRKAYLIDLVKNNAITFNEEGIEQFLVALNENSEIANLNLLNMNEISFSVEEVRPSLNVLKAKNKGALSLNQVKLFLSSAALNKHILTLVGKKNFSDNVDVASKLSRLTDQVVYASFIKHKIKPANDYPDAATLQAAYQKSLPSLQVGTMLDIKQVILPLNAPDVDMVLSKMTAAMSASRLDIENLATMGGLQVNQQKVLQSQLFPQVKAELAKAGENVLGHVHGPVKLSDGWHFILVTEVLPPRALTLAEVTPKMVEALRLNHAKVREKQYLKALVDKVPITVNKSLVSDLL